MTQLHPTDESLVAYLECDLDADAERSLETHVRDCDLCVADLTRIQLHLGTPPDVAHSVPPQVRARVDNAFRPSAAASSLPPPSRATRRPAGILRWPVLIPTSLAAGFLIGLSVAALRLPDTRVTTRGVDPVEKSYSVAAGTVIRDAPSDRAGEVAALRSGDRVFVLERRGGWARIQGPDGHDGWVRADSLR